MSEQCFNGQICFIYSFLLSLKTEGLRRCFSNWHINNLTLKKEFETVQIQLKSLYSQPVEFHIQ